MTYFLKLKFPAKSLAVKYSLAGTPNLPSSCPSLVYLADMYGIYKSNEPLLIKKTSFEVKHCKIETEQSKTRSCLTLRVSPAAQP